MAQNCEEALEEEFFQPSESSFQNLAFRMSALEDTINEIKRGSLSLDPNNHRKSEELLEYRSDLKKVQEEYQQIMRINKISEDDADSLDLQQLLPQRDLANISPKTNNKPTELGNYLQVHNDPNNPQNSNNSDIKSIGSSSGPSARASLDFLQGQSLRDLAVHMGDLEKKLNNIYKEIQSDESFATRDSIFSVYEEEQGIDDLKQELDRAALPELTASFSNKSDILDSWVTEQEGILRLFIEENSRGTEDLQGSVINNRESVFSVEEEEQGLDDLKRELHGAALPPRESRTERLSSSDFNTNRPDIKENSWGTEDLQGSVINTRESVFSVEEEEQDLDDLKRELDGTALPELTTSFSNKSEGILHNIRNDLQSQGSVINTRESVFSLHEEEQGLDDLKRELDGAALPPRESRTEKLSSSDFNTNKDMEEDSGGVEHPRNPGSTRTAEPPSPAVLVTDDKENNNRRHEKAAAKSFSVDVVQQNPVEHERAPHIVSRATGGFVLSDSSVDFVFDDYDDDDTEPVEKYDKSNRGESAIFLLEQQQTVKYTEKLESQEDPSPSDERHEDTDDERPEVMRPVVTEYPRDGIDDGTRDLEQGIVVIKNKETTSNQIIHFLTEHRRAILIATISLAIFDILLLIVGLAGGFE